MYRADGKVGKRGDGHFGFLLDDHFEHIVAVKIDKIGDSKRHNLTPPTYLQKGYWSGIK